MPPLPAARPSQANTLGDHEKRIRALERDIDIDTESELNHRGWPTMFDLPLSVGAGGAGGWTYEIDNAVPFNRKIVHTGAASDDGAQIWLLNLAPGAWTPYFSMLAGTGMGTIAMYVAGAYDFQTDDVYPTVLDPASGDWIFVGENDLSTLSDSYWINRYLLQEISSGYSGVSTFAIQNEVDQYVKSTSIDISGVLDGSSGYYYFKIVCDGGAEISQIVILNDGARFGGSIL